GPHDRARTSGQLLFRRLNHLLPWDFLTEAETILNPFMEHRGNAETTPSDSALLPPLSAMEFTQALLQLSNHPDNATIAVEVARLWAIMAAHQRHSPVTFLSYTVVHTILTTCGLDLFANQFARAASLPDEQRVRYEKASESQFPHLLKWLRWLHAVIAG